MVTTATTNPVELRALDGQVHAYLVPAAEMDRMQAEIAALQEQVATLQRQKDRYVVELTEMLKTHIPIPPTDEEMLAAEANPGSLADLIAELEADVSPVSPLIVIEEFK